MSIAPRQKLSPKTLEMGALALIVVVGSYLRLFEIEFGQYMPDDITLWNIVHSTLAKPHVLTSGMESSFGVPNGPFQAYLLLPGAWIASGHIGAYITVAVMNIVGIVLFWAFVRSYWGPRIALLAALLYATNPWGVVFSRRLWGNDMVAPFTVLLIWSLCDLVRKGRRRDSVLPFVWLAMVIQLYVAALIHLALVVLGLGFGWRRLRPLEFLGGIVLFFVLIGPYLLGTLWPNIYNINNLLGTTGAKPEVDLASISFMFHIVSSEGYQAFANQMGSMLDATTGVPYVVSRLTEVLLAIGLVAGIYEVVRQCQQRAFDKALAYLLPLVAVVLPPLLLVRHTSTVYPFYLFTGFPMHFLFVALGIVWVGKALRRVSMGWPGPLASSPTYAMGGLVVFIVATHLILGQVFFTAIQGFWSKSAYGLPLKYALNINETAKRLVRENGYARVYLGGTEINDSITYRALRPDLPFISAFDSTDTLVKPNASVGKVLYILSSSEDRIGKAFAERLKYAEVAGIDLPGGGVRYSFYGVDADDLAKVFSDTPGEPLAVTFDNRVRLDSYIVDSDLHPGEQAQLVLRWSIFPGAAVPSYYTYVRIVDQTNKVRGGTTLSDVAQWHPGEQLIWWRTLPTPADLEPGAYSYLVGLYTAGSSSPYRNASAVDARGANLGKGVLFGRSVVRSTVEADPPNHLSTSFGGKISLEGYGLALPPILLPAREGLANNSADGTVVPGAALDIDLYWKALDKMDRDYTVFVHFLGPDGKILAQHDSQPADRRYPTTAWRKGDSIVDRHRLQIPAGLAPGQYSVRVGLYDLATGERLGGPEQAAVFRVTVK